MSDILALVMAILLFKTNVKYNRAALAFGITIDFIYLLNLIWRLWDGKVSVFDFLLSAAVFLVLLIAVADGYRAVPRRGI